MWVPGEDTYFEMDLPMPSIIANNFEMYLEKKKICGDGVIEKVECVLTDPEFSTRTLDDVCVAATHIKCKKHCPKFQYHVRMT